MKIKVLTIILLAGGALFAENRNSTGIGFSDRETGSYQPQRNSHSYTSGYQVAPQFDNRLRGSDDRRDFGRISETDGDRGFDHNQNRSENRRQDRAFDQRDLERNRKLSNHSNGFGDR